MLVEEIITENKIIADILPHKETFNAIILNAWSDYLEEINYSDYARSIHNKTTRANVIHSHIIHNAKKQFQNIAGVAFLEIRGIFFVSIQNKYLIRFKMLDNNIRHKNFQTPHAIAFDKQENLPGIPHGVRLVVGYVLNSLETKIKDIYLTCPNGSNNKWFLSLTAKTSARMFEFPVVSTIYEVQEYLQPKEDIKEKKGNDTKKN